MLKAEVLKKADAKYIAAIDPAELAVRMLEAAARVSRPADVSAMQALLSLEDEDRERWLRAANAAMEYWRERIALANQPS